MNADEVQADQDGYAFDKRPAQVDHDASLRSAEQPTVPGMCPVCRNKEYWGSAKLGASIKLENRHPYAGENFWCLTCACDRVAVPIDPTQKTPELVENPWMKATRLEQELASMTRRCAENEIALKAACKELAEWVKECDGEIAMRMLAEASCKIVREELKRKTVDHQVTRHYAYTMAIALLLFAIAFLVRL